jgi:prevent-host-death family protein
VERIGVRELRQNASRYLAMVKSGQRVEVTERGKLVALLVPPTASSSARDALIASGTLKPATRPLRLPDRHAVPPSGPTPSEALAELREDRG